MARARVRRFVVVLAILELGRDWVATKKAGALPRRPGEAAPRGEPLSAGELAVLVLGGAVHGAFATGGPMVVYVSGRRLEDKAAFRATLSTLWLVLNLVLVASFLAAGTLGPASLERTALLAPALGLGLLAGEWVHGRVPAERFRTGVFAMLAVAGVALVVRA